MAVCDLQKDNLAGYSKERTSLVVLIRILNIRKKVNKRVKIGGVKM
jgi:hypothetical protein